MTYPRRWALAVLVTGIAMGTLTDTLPERVVPRAGEYLILSGDFHVHAAPADGTLLPWELRREARRAGLDVVAVTNHNSILAGRLAHAWASYFDGPFAIVLAGEEITSPDYHMAAVGLTRVVDRRNDAASAVEEIHAQGGVAIAAHPARRYWAGYDTAIAALDGAEMAALPDRIYAAEFGEFFRRARARNPDIAAVGSSDFHAWPSLGLRRTYLFARERTEASVLDAIRSGRTVAEDEQKNLYGDPEWVRQVEANRPTGRVDTNAAWRRLSVGCAWCGLLGMILLRRSTT
jgi:predicted metal-dependent phosphoesterase TrpH